MVTNAQRLEAGILLEARGPSRRWAGRGRCAGGIRRASEPQELKQAGIGLGGAGDQKESV